MNRNEFIMNDLKNYWVEVNPDYAVKGVPENLLAIDLKPTYDTPYYSNAIHEIVVYWCKLRNFKLLQCIVLMNYVYFIVEHEGMQRRYGQVIGRLFTMFNRNWD